MQSKWHTYQNGNCTTHINVETGTKIHETLDDEFKFAFSESCDVNITDKCDGGCPWCYQGCTPNKSHGKLLGHKFLETLHPYTELAINGNDLSHPELIPFLEQMKEQHILVSMTVNQKHFMQHIDFINLLLERKLINGLGVSLVSPTQDFIDTIKKYPTAVIHVIAGLFSQQDMDALSGHDLKLLILGYKTTKNRGKTYYDNKIYKASIENGIAWLKSTLKEHLSDFDVVSFDNLAIEQLNVREMLGEKQWQEFYMGDDGTHTFYIDLVKGVFARTSLSEEQYPLMESIDDMFNVIKELEQK